MYIYLIVFILTYVVVIVIIVACSLCLFLSRCMFVLVNCLLIAFAIICVAEVTVLSLRVNVLL